jgi:hypothetical protein
MRLKLKENALPSRYSKSSNGRGSGYYVRATLTDGTVDRIEGFTTAGEAGRWIKNESIV